MSENMKYKPNNTHIPDCCVGIRHVYLKRVRERDLPSILASLSPRPSVRRWKLQVSLESWVLAGPTVLLPTAHETTANVDLANPRILVVPPKYLASSDSPRRQLRPKTDQARSGAEMS